ncbi:hypothetical protein J4463_00350 [Candidatus Pacearchaeota archaeon]|nr:hypothetical protein [Candidatus Pacearchaeota archaeon]
MKLKINKKDKKAQLKIQQMSFMLVALVFFFVLVLLFYLAIRTSGLAESKKFLENERAVGIAMKISSMPEFNYEGVPNALDADKLMILRGKTEYKELFGNSIEGIIVQKIYPADKDVECKISNYPDCTKIKLFTEKEFSSAYSYVALCRKEKGAESAFTKCELAIIMVGVKDNSAK